MPATESAVQSTGFKKIRGVPEDQRFAFDNLNGMLYYYIKWIFDVVSLAAAQLGTPIGSNTSYFLNQETPMTTRLTRSMATLSIGLGLAITPQAMAANATDMQKLIQEVQALKKNYEARTAELEIKLKNLEKKQASNSAKATGPGVSSRNIRDNSFNPSIGIVLNGRASSFTSTNAEIAGFSVGEEGERGSEGVAIDETELNFSANIDDKFYGSMTAAIVREDGSDKIELEEAYIQTVSGAGLPNGASVKAGRAFWTFGYLNEHHAHADDFADRPLTSRVYLNKAFNDDGAEISFILPTDQYAELGGGMFRGDDFPGGGSLTGLGSWSAYARTGGDIGDNQSWRLGVYTLQSDVNSRATEEGALTFVGQNTLYAADLRYTFAPTGDASKKEVILQAEVMYREEDGTYNDTEAGTGTVSYDESSLGWYAQAIYKFAPSWRVGARYARLNAADTPEGFAGSALDSAGHDPETFSVMGDWTNSEFGRFRLQYNREELAEKQEDNQFLVQYVMSIGAHGAHAY